MQEAPDRDRDPPDVFVQQIVLYVAAAVVIGGLFVQADWAAWTGLHFSVVMILVSILYYNPVIMSERKPGIGDWVDDLLFTGLPFEPRHCCCARSSASRSRAEDSRGPDGGRAAYR